jgi:uncharacterized RDD family membrane protein YckC
MEFPLEPQQLDQFTPTVALPGREASGPVSHQLAGAGARALAGLLDLLLQGISFALLAWAAVTARPDLFPRAAWPWAIPVGFVEWHVIYLMLFESFSRGRTPGLAAVGLQVIGCDRKAPRPVQSVLRNLVRLPDMALGLYAASFWMISRSAQRQSLGDRLSKTMVVYSAPLREQMAASSVPESFYSTSEAGYLLQAWMERNARMDEDSQAASALDLSAYLHHVYEPEARELPEPATYLRSLFEKEMAEHHLPESVEHPVSE